MSSPVHLSELQLGPAVENSYVGVLGGFEGGASESKAGELGVVTDAPAPTGSSNPFCLPGNHHPQSEEQSGDRFAEKLPERCHLRPPAEAQDLRRVRLGRGLLCLYPSMQFLVSLLISHERLAS